ncbi:MAG: YraN family protein [Chloroflexaceae bacterium]|nr:YraN family protein [Chloroflexaceae bacterium]NJO06718.1 YraN family protein [Chloroflexaceae bacterium]
MTQRRRMGRFGETAAAAYLERQGYTVRERNWRCATGELDLVLEHAGQLVFVEVRTRRGTTHGTPEESVTARKRERLIALAYAYLQANDVDDQMPWRIDVIALELDSAGRMARINHLMNAVEEV